MIELALIHLFAYPLITGILFMLFVISLINGNRWVLVTGPAFIGMAMLTFLTFVNYADYLI